MAKYTYIGETARNLEVRVNEHLDVKKQPEPAKHISRETPQPQVHVGGFNHCQFMAKKENIRSVLHHTLPSKTKQTSLSATTGPHLVPHENFYYITDIT